MLRALVAVLVLANAGYFAWSQGHLAALGLAPTQQSEPERLSTQINPADLRLQNGPFSDATVPAPAPVAAAPTLGPSEPAPDTTAPVPVPEPTACWRASGFAAEQTAALRKTLAQQGWPNGSWQLNENRSSGRWVVYMGRYNDEQMARKKEELKELKIEFREVNLPTLGPGLALGTYFSEAAVQQALQDVTRKGVRSARTAQERPEAITFTLQLPAITEQQRAAVAGKLGKPLQRCS